MTIQHRNYCKRCDTEWHRKHGDKCPECGNYC